MPIILSPSFSSLSPMKTFNFLFYFHFSVDWIIQEIDVIYFFLNDSSFEKSKHNNEFVLPFNTSYKNCRIVIKK